MDKSFILWNVDTLDWKSRDSNLIYNEIIKKIESGNIILMHDLYDESVEATLRVIDELSTKGYIFVSLEELEKNNIFTYNKRDRHRCFK